MTPATVLLAGRRRHGALALDRFLPSILLCLGVLPAFRVLLVWVYDRTGSLLLAVMMHASLTGGLSLTIIPLALVGLPPAIWYLALIGALWGAVTVVVAPRGARRAAPPLGLQAT